MQIVQLTGELAGDDFAKIFAEYRTKRRAVRATDQNEYAKLILESSKKLDELMDAQVIKLLGELRVDMATYQRNCEM